MWVAPLNLTSTLWSLTLLELRPQGFWSCVSADVAACKEQPSADALKGIEGWLQAETPVYSFDGKALTTAFYAQIDDGKVSQVLVVPSGKQMSTGSAPSAATKSPSSVVMRWTGEPLPVGRVID